MACPINFILGMLWSKIEFNDFASKIPTSYTYISYMKYRPNV